MNAQQGAAEGLGAGSTPGAVVAVDEACNVTGEGRCASLRLVTAQPAARRHRREPS
jgi:hypothetical protein